MYHYMLYYTEVEVAFVIYVLQNRTNFVSVCSLSFFLLNVCHYRN